MYQLPKEIFICGRMGSGKGFVAAQLFNEAGFTELNFADPLKADVATRHSISVEELNFRKAEFRRELQEYGAEMRDTDEDYWVKRWAQRRAEVDGPVVCSDLRYQNEAIYAVNIGALVVRVITPEFLRIKRITQRDGTYDAAWMNHPSEQAYDSLPVHIDFPGTLPARSVVPALEGAFLRLLELDS